MDKHEMMINGKTVIFVVSMDKMQTIDAIKAKASDKKALNSENYGKDQLKYYRDNCETLHNAITASMLNDNDETFSALAIEWQKISVFHGFASVICEDNRAKGITYTDDRFKFNRQIRDFLIACSFKFMYSANMDRRIPDAISPDTFRKNLESLIININDGVEGYIVTPENKAKARKAKKDANKLEEKTKREAAKTAKAEAEVAAADARRIALIAEIAKANMAKAAAETVKTETETAETVKTETETAETVKTEKTA